MTNMAIQLAPKAKYLLILSLVVLAGSLYLPVPRAGLALLTVGGSLLCLVGLIVFLTRRNDRSQSRLHRAIAGYVEFDASPSFTTDLDGAIGYRNGAAKERFGGANQNTLVATLGNMFASPGATLARLQNKAQENGAASEDVVVRRGHLRLSVHRIGTAGFLWRLEDILERSQGGQSLDGISLPMMTISSSDTILFMNEAMRKLINGRQTKLNRVINDLPLQSGKTHEIAGMDGPVASQVSIVQGAAGRREVYFLPVHDATALTADSWEPLEALPVALLKLTADGKIIVCNRLARTLLATAEPKGKYLGDLVEGLGRLMADWLSETIDMPGQVRSEFVRAIGHSKDVFIQITLTPIQEAGETHLVVVLNDATELKTLEAQFVQSQKMQAIGQLAGGVAHDFNNLLTAISGHCDLLLLRHDEGDPEYGDLIQINQNSNRAASLVGQLLAFSRKQTLKPEVVDVRDILDDLAHLLNRLVGETVTLKLTHDPDLKPIRADIRQLEQVIMNLVVNARDAMPKGGNVCIDTHSQQITDPFEKDRAVIPVGDYVVITVTDEGSGIPIDKLSKIFEPFFTTKRTGEGTGLGLSMAYGIVKQTGGYIFADSTPGSGTVFTLYFPVNTQTHSAVTNPAKETPKPTHLSTGGVVLLVEDEAPVRAFASRALKLRGYTVLEAESAEEALKTLEDKTLNIDVFVTDVIMPGMDGPSWVAKALEQRPHVRVVFVSGYAEDSFSEQQARIPNSVFLPKPFSLNELTATVQNQIH
ncbi:MAG: ATP-binding protein [Paracoccaceae bacterium]